MREVARVAGGLGANVAQLKVNARYLARLVEAPTHREHREGPAVVVLDQKGAQRLALAR